MDDSSYNSSPRVGVRKGLIIALIAVVLIAAGFFVWFYRDKLTGGAATEETSTSTPSSLTLRPNGDVTSGWNAFPIASWGEHFRLINEKIADDTDYIFTNWTCKEDIYAFKNPASEDVNETIKAIDVQYRAKCLSANCAVSINTNIGGWQTPQSHNVGPKWENGSSHFRGAWSGSLLNDLQVKIRKSSGISQLQVSQLYVDVEYTIEPAPDTAVPTSPPTASEPPITSAAPTRPGETFEPIPDATVEPTERIVEETAQPITETVDEQSVLLKNIELKTSNNQNKQVSPNNTISLVIGETLTFTGVSLPNEKLTVIIEPKEKDKSKRTEKVSAAQDSSWQYTLNPNTLGLDEGKYIIKAYTLSEGEAHAVKLADINFKSTSDNWKYIVIGILAIISIGILLWTLFRNRR